MPLTFKLIPSEKVRNNILLIKHILNQSIKTKKKITRKEISELTRLSMPTLCKYHKAGYVKLPYSQRGPRGKITENKELVDRMLARGESFAEIGRQINLSRQRISKSIKSKQARELKQNLEPKQNLVNILLSYTLKEAFKQGIEEEVIHHFKQGREEIQNKVASLERLISLVIIYKNAKNKGKKPSYKNLAEQLGISPSYVRVIMKEMDLEPFNQRYNKKLSQEKQEAIIRAYFNLDYLSYKDLIYFLGIRSTDTITVILKNLNLKKKKWKAGIKRLNGRNLTHRDASQIYAFKDEFNSSEEEITDLIGKNKEIVFYALEHRDEISPRLIHALQVLYPKEKIEKPYR